MKGGRLGEVVEEIVLRSAVIVEKKGGNSRYAELQVRSVAVIDTLSERVLHGRLGLAHPQIGPGRMRNSRQSVVRERTRVPPENSSALIV